MPVVTRVSHATRAAGSLAMMASRTASEIWSAILSGWPSVTDSDVKTWRCAGMCVSDLPLDVQPSRTPFGGQPGVGIQELHIHRFRKRETECVEHVVRAARVERRVRRRTRLQRADLAHGPLDERQG